MAPPGNRRSASPAGNSSWRDTTCRAARLQPSKAASETMASASRSRSSASGSAGFWVFSGLMVGNIGGSPGFPRVFPCDTTAASYCARSRSGTPPYAWKEAIEVQVLVRENNVDQALRVLKKKMQREGIFREMKLRRNYEKPSERRARERAEAIRRTRKLMRKRMEREGY